MSTFVVQNSKSFRPELKSPVSEHFGSKDRSNESILKDASYALIVLGSIIGGISFFGCVGAWKESTLFLFLYTILMIAMILAQIALFLLVSEGSFLHDKARDVMKESMNPYKAKNKNSSLFKLWDLTSTGLQCCGVDGYEDFHDKSMDCYTIPGSCYKMNDACINGTFLATNSITYHATNSNHNNTNLT